MSARQKRLDMSHGILHGIRKHQFDQAQQLREEQERLKSSDNSRSNTPSPSSISRRKREDKLVYVGNVVAPGNEHININRPKPCEKASSSEADWIDQNNNMEVFPHPDLVVTVLDNVTSLQAYQLAQAAEALVNTACGHPEYRDRAIEAAHTIVQQEYEYQQEMVIPNYVFRRSFMDICKVLCAKRDQLYEQGRYENFVCFLGNAVAQVRPAGQVQLSLANSVHTVIQSHLTPPFVGQTKHLQTLAGLLESCGVALISHDRDLMGKVIDNVRDVFLHPATAEEARKILLYVIELYAAGWHKTKDMDEFYDDVLSSSYGSSHLLKN